MKTRIFFVALFLVGVSIGAPYFVSFMSENDFVWPVVSQRFLLLIILGIIFQLTAHVLRAYKSKLLLDPIRRSDTATLFKGLSIGYLFNLLLPFRAGELIRAFYVGDALSISKTTVFISIIIERIADGAFLSLCFVATSFIIAPLSAEASSLMLRFGIGVFIISLLLATLIYLLRSENSRILRIIYSVTAIFNKNIVNRMRFMAWSGIHGTKLMLASRRRLVRYAALSIGMWLLYFMSVALVALAFFTVLDLTKLWYTVQTTYVGVSAPSGPGYLGTFHIITTNLLGLIGLPDSSTFSFLDWIILVTPISLIGIGVLIKQKFTPYSKVTTQEALINKLHREADISKEFSQFMAAYLKGERINRILSNAELENKFKLVRSFKGGSNAHTMLVWQNDELRVKKITLPQFADKLEAQAQWLNERSNLEHIPRVVAEEHTQDYYYFDLKYLESFYPFFEFMHKNSTTKNFQVIKNMLNFMNDSVYIESKRIVSKKNLMNYIESKVLGKVNDTALVNEHINHLLANKKIKVNGVAYDNMLQVIEKIKKNKKAVYELSSYSESAIHGDLTVDNLIVSSSGDFLVIDPNNENQVSAPVVDYGKLYQSLDSGYEFLIQLEQCNLDKNKIDFEDSTSHKYAELFAKVDELLKKNLQPEEYRTILFHEAVHYCRMLTYRVNINPGTVAVFYGTAVRLFNEYLAQYD